MGNLTGKGSTGYAYPGGGQVRPHTPTSVGGLAYSYDANGNLLSGSGRTLNWDVDNKPYSITSGPMTNWETYRYDPDGERVRRTKGSTTTVYLAGGSWEETLGGERRLLQNFNGQVVAQRSSTLGTTYLHSDHLGGASVSSDFQGNNIQHQEFDPWGKVRSGGISSTTINYTGQRLDDGTGLLYYHARYYDPAVGKFTSADTIVPSTTNPQAFNRYGYAYNNPLKFKDATGHRAGDYDNNDNSSSNDYNPNDYGGDYYDEPQPYDGEYVQTTEVASDHIWSGHNVNANTAPENKFPADWDKNKVNAAVESVYNYPDKVVDDKDVEENGRNNRYGVYEGVKIKVIGGDTENGENGIVSGFPDTKGYNEVMGLSFALQPSSSDFTFAPPPLSGSVPVGGQTLTVSPNPAASSDQGTNFPAINLPKNSNIATTPLMGGVAGSSILLLALLILI